MKRLMVEVIHRSDAYDEKIDVSIRELLNRCLSSFNEAHFDDNINVISTQFNKEDKGQNNKFVELIVTFTRNG